MLVPAEGSRRKTNFNIKFYDNTKSQGGQLYTAVTHWVHSWNHATPQRCSLSAAEIHSIPITVFFINRYHVDDCLSRPVCSGSAHKIRFTSWLSFPVEWVCLQPVPRLGVSVKAVWRSKAAWLVMVHQRPEGGEEHEWQGPVLHLFFPFYLPAPCSVSGPPPPSLPLYPSTGFPCPTPPFLPFPLKCLPILAVPALPLCPPAPLALFLCPTSSVPFACPLL